MEINRSPVSSRYLASLLRQREIAGVSPKVNAIPDHPATGPQRRDPPSDADADDVRLALQALEENSASAERRAQREDPIVNNRVRVALATYLAQQNQAGEDARVSLRQMLGIDYYA